MQIHVHVYPDMPISNCSGTNKDLFPFTKFNCVRVLALPVKSLSFLHRIFPTSLQVHDHFSETLISEFYSSMYTLYLVNINI